MWNARQNIVVRVAAVALCGWAALPLHASVDIDGNGYVDLRDYIVLSICHELSGPGTQPLFQECIAAFDGDGDNDVDLADCATFQRSLGHLPITLRDTLGNALTAGSAAPHSGRQTCGFGGCHDTDQISNGYHFQQGRTDAAGNMIMHDDFFGDGRPWFRSPARYGRWSQASGVGYELAAKQSANESEIDRTPFAWVAECGACHVGGGPGELDRDGQPLFDTAAGKFGYEQLGKTPEEVALDGDYTHRDPVDGNLRPAPWDATGVSEPDCLCCHRSERAVQEGTTLNWVWRYLTLAAGPYLVDDAGDPVPAYAAAATAGQGWFSSLDIGQSFPPRLQISYGVGLVDGSLRAQPDGSVALSPNSCAATPRDYACWPCHGSGAFQVVGGVSWFDPRDVHYARFNNLHDDDPVNDIPPARSTACSYCHTGDTSHNLAKGNSFQMQYRDELDFAQFRSCRECHLTISPLRHPDAPQVPGTVIVHQMRPFDVLSCQACHIPYPLLPALAFIDHTVGGGPSTVGATSVFYSADPLNPEDPDKSKWWFALLPKADSDGVIRYFPCSIWISIYWADWDRRGTPGDLSDDIIRPVLSWRLRELTGGQPLAVVSDDNGDGQLEVNRPEEILAYIRLLRGSDRYGRQVAADPVLVRGRTIWYEDPQSSSGVSSFDHVGAGLQVPVESEAYIFGMDHNVLAKELSLGYHPINPLLGCQLCHRPDTLNSPVFDRKVLVDPWGPDGKPIYTTVRAMTGLDPS